MEKHELKFLLVDDSELVRMSIKKTLVQLGYSSVDEALDGSEALEKMHLSIEENAPYTMVFCDWLMPKMDGLQVLQACQSSRTLKQIPIVMITAEAEQKSVLVAVRAGAIGYIMKPLEAAQLKFKIEHILAKYHAPKAA